MKTIASLLVVAFAVTTAYANPQQLSSEAQRAYLAGDLATAKAKFQTVLEADPKNITAINYLRMIKTQEAQNGGSQLAKQLESLILPKVELKDASFSTALEYLKQRAADQKVAVSFVSQIPKETMDATSVSLNLRDAPFTESLRYICQMAGAIFVVEKYAVVIKSAPADAPAN